MVNAAVEFGQLPSTVARDMARDPECLTVTCIPLLGYARCKSEWDAHEGDEEKMKHWKGTEALKAVTRNTFDSRVARVKHQKHTVPDEGCRYCKAKGAKRGR